MKKINFNSIVLVLLIILVSCNGDKGSQPAEVSRPEDIGTTGMTDAQVKIAGIRLGQVEERQISGIVTTNGKLDVPPQQMVSVSAPLGGFLKSTSLLQGSKVSKGQIIAVIENPDYIQLQQDYLEARNQLEYANADYARQQELARENVNAQKTVQLAKTSYLNALARRNGLAAKLELINIDLRSLEAGNITSTAKIYSPIAGYVTTVNVNLGKYVGPSDVLFTIVDTEHLHAELTIFEKDIPRIRVGQVVRFLLANENSERTATIYLVGREIRSDRTITVHCHIDKEDKDLLPGMFLKATIETEGSRVSALPETAVIGYMGKKYIFVLDPAPVESTTQDENGRVQHFRMVEIETGESESGFIEMILPEGFDRSVQVVIEGGYSILSKMKNSEEVD